MTIYTYEEALSASVEFFEGDEFSAKVFLDKYALKNKQGELTEDTPDKMYIRLSEEFSRIENKYPNPISQSEIKELLEGFKYLIPGGSPMSGIGNNYKVQSLSNCYVIGNKEDSYSSIIMIDEEQVHIMRRRGGVGHDLSHLRPNGSLTTSAANTSTGVVTFAERYSNTTREVAQDGRRGALMLSLDVRHPDIEDFIDSKLEQNKITGANISIKLSDDFIQKALEDKLYTQQFLIDSDNPIIKKEISAKHIWDKIIKNAHHRAEPGVFFWDKVLSESPAKGYGEQYIETSSNPCVTGDTLILTDKGEIRIDSVINKNINVWNGYIWSDVIPKITGCRQKILKLTFEEKITGIIRIIKCTPYHKFILFGFSKDSSKRIEAKNLNIGDLICGYFDSTKTTHPSILVSIEEQLELEDFVYCFDEPIRHSGVFNGLLTANCGEIPMGNYSSCILMSLNLYSFVDNPFTKESFFNFNKFNTYSRKAFRLIDDLVDLEIEKIQTIISKVNSDPEDEITKLREVSVWNKILNTIINTRRVGLGITAEGDMLAALNLTYGTPEASIFMEEVHKQLAINSYTESINLAKERGPFPIQDNIKDLDSDFFNRILINLSQNVVEDWNIYGRRNIACLTIAPTGSISLMTQTTSGVEPAFQISYKRRRKINPENKNTKVDFIDSIGDKWEEYMVFHHKFIEWYYLSPFNRSNENHEFLTKKECKEHLSQLDKKVLDSIIEQSPYYKATSYDIDWLEKVRAQGMIQQWIDHSISVTVNIPETTSVEVVSQIYEHAWRSGCKGCTIYREGSRSGVLISNDNKEEQLDIKERPKEVECDINHITYKGKRYIVLVGIIDSKPYEIFAFESDLDNKYKKGKLIKVKSQTYDLKIEDDGIIKNIVKEFDNPLEGSLTRQISLNLKHSPLEDIFIQLQKEGNISDYNKVLSRTLKKYLTKEMNLTSTCPECNSQLQMKEGCISCQSCGYSKCG